MGKQCKDNGMPTQTHFKERFWKFTCMQYSAVYAKQQVFTSKAVTGQLCQWDLGAMEPFSCENKYSTYIGGYF